MAKHAAKTTANTNESATAKTAQITTTESNSIIEPPGDFCERYRKLKKLFEGLSLGEHDTELSFNIITLAIEPGEFEWINQAFNNSLSALALDKPEIKNFIKWWCFWNLDYGISDYQRRARFQKKVTKDLIEQSKEGQPLAVALRAHELFIRLPGGAAPVTDKQVLQEVIQMREEVA